MLIKFQLAKNNLMDSIDPAEKHHDDILRNRSKEIVNHIFQIFY